MLGNEEERKRKQTNKQDNTEVQEGKSTEKPNQNTNLQSHKKTDTQAFSQAHTHRRASESRTREKLTRQAHGEAKLSQTAGQEQ